MDTTEIEKRAMEMCRNRHAGNWMASWDKLTETDKSDWRSLARVSLGCPTAEDIDRIKADWLEDPCFDIEDTEGLDDHRAELLEWRQGIERQRTIERLSDLHRVCRRREAFGHRRWEDAVMNAAMTRSTSSAIELVDSILERMERAVTEANCAHSELRKIGVHVD